MHNENNTAGSYIILFTFAILNYLIKENINNSHTQRRQLAFIRH